MISMRKKLSDALIGSKVMCFPQWRYFRKYSKYTFIELDGDQPVEAVQQELLLKVFG